MKFKPRYATPEEISKARNWALRHPHKNPFQRHVPTRIKWACALEQLRFTLGKMPELNLGFPPHTFTSN
jgi:hypothetical protein